MKNIIVIGGGAAGVFAAIAAAEAGAQVTVLERGAKFLAKVKISGGGRCNLTHACFDPQKLVENYPRGGKTLLGPFHKFQPRDTVKWFESRGVKTKTEPDGRMFPVTNDSQTVIDALLGAARGAGVELRSGVEIAGIERAEKGFRLSLPSGTVLEAGRLLLASGGGHQGHAWAKALGHGLVPPVPSLFTFTVKDPRLEGLAGLSVEGAEVKIPSGKLSQSGPLLITHWGLSGPAVLKLSAWGARYLHSNAYEAEVLVNWLEEKPEAAAKALDDLKRSYPRRQVGGQGPEKIPARLWERLAGEFKGVRWGDLTREGRQKLANELTAGRYQLAGKGVFKEEFVTAGGVKLDEVDFRTMESRRCPGLFFAGEILDIDGLTGGFNFQSAWTTGWLAGRAMASSR